MTHSQHLSAEAAPARAVPGRTTVEGVRVVLTSGRLLTLVPVDWSASGELCIVRQVAVSTRAVRERRGFVVTHVRTGRGLHELERLVDAKLLVRLLDRHPLWAFAESDLAARQRALAECSSILDNFPCAQQSQQPTGAPRPAS